MFKRKKTERDQAHPVTPMPPPVTPPVTAAAPPPDAAGEPRTTCYPQDADAPPPVVGEQRTTVYRQAVRWNRGGYDTTN